MATEGLIKKKRGRKRREKRKRVWGKREGQHGRLTLTSLETFCVFPEPKLGCSWKRKRLELF